MSFPALNAYLQRLSDPAVSPASLWLNQRGQAEGRFFNCTLTSAFQPVIEVGSGEVRGWEAVARGASADDAERSLWRQLDHAASDDESVELDRLCRMLHAINFFRQAPAAGADLFLSVHDRLLSAVSINHGHAFRRILDALGLPAERVVLQLPAASANQRWLLSYVTDNYKRNGFRMALNLGEPGRAAELLTQVRPAAIRIDAGDVGDDDALAALAAEVHRHGVQLIVKKVQTMQALGQLARVAARLALPIHAQGAAIHAARETLQREAAAEQGAPARHLAQDRSLSS